MSNPTPEQPGNGQPIAPPQGTPPRGAQQHGHQPSLPQDPRQHGGQPFASQPYGGQPYAGRPYGAQAPAAARSRSRRRAIVAASALALAIPTVGAFAYVDHVSRPSAVTATLPEARPGAQGLDGSGLDGSGLGPAEGSQSEDQGSSPRTMPYGRGRTGTGTTTNGTAVSSAPGVLLIDGEVPGSVTGGSGGRSAGTGMVLSEDGYALTNYHVVRGTSTVRVTVADTGKTFTATVVGADATHDVALLRLKDASGLTPVKIDRDKVSVGDAVTAVGQGGGLDKLFKVSGTVQALDDQIRVSADETSSGHALSGLIRTDAGVVPGYSGGPMFDAQGEVLGISTAASTGSRPEGYAIPIQQAMSIADMIKDGKTNKTVRVGPKAALGVQVTSATTGPTGASGAVVAGVTSGSAAQSAGLGKGDTITQVDGTPITGADALQAAIGAHTVGEDVTVAWTDASGERHTQRVSLKASPIN